MTASIPDSLSMEPEAALEQLLDALLPTADMPPEALHRAMRHAVFPAGKRVRSRLLLAVASACDASDGALVLARHAAAALELVHCASLVHDDLPCFDDAALRRGRPSVHSLYGEAVAVLAGDALLCRAFEALSAAPPRLARRSMQILGRLSQATGSTQGLIGGQGLESAPPAQASPEYVERYHAMKTASLFCLATEAGAIAAGATNMAGWRQLGLMLSAAMQRRPTISLSQVSQHIDGLAAKPAPLHAFLAHPEFKIGH